jgi:hypothetical protein
VAPEPALTVLSRLLASHRAWTINGHDPALTAFGPTAVDGQPGG